MMKLLGAHRPALAMDKNFKAKIFLGALEKVHKRKMQQNFRQLRQRLVAKPARTRTNQRDVRLVQMVNKLHLKLVMIKSQTFGKIKEKCVLQGGTGTQNSAAQHSTG